MSTGPLIGARLNDSKPPSPSCGQARPSGYRIDTTTTLTQGATVDALVRALVREELQPALDLLRRIAERLAHAEQGGGGEFLSVPEAAQVARVGESTIRVWIRVGRLRAGRAGRLVRIKRADLAELIAAAHSEPEAIDSPEDQAAQILGRKRSAGR
jgi:excisionase family DNA binding protein